MDLRRLFRPSGGRGCVLIRNDPLSRGGAGSTGLPSKPCMRSDHCSAMTAPLTGWRSNSANPAVTSGQIAICSQTGGAYSISTSKIIDTTTWPTMTMTR